MHKPLLLPRPRHLRLTGGVLLLPKLATVQLDPWLSAQDAPGIIRRLNDWNTGFHSGAEAVTFQTRRSGDQTPAAIRATRIAPNRCHPAPANAAPPAPELRGEFHTITIDQRGVRVECRDPAGLRAAVATLRQLLRQFGAALPTLEIRDWPDFPRRGFMLDISRGRVPNLGTLLELADRLADFKINELQLYTEHTFAWRKWRAVWKDWGAVTGTDLRALDRRCRELGIDLVPNQNSFGHLREYLADPRLRPLAEIAEPWPDGGGTFYRYPSTLAPTHPGTLPFIRALYDELLPNFTSSFFNVGCDETWDLGRGQSKAECETRGKGRVYLDFLRQLHREVTARGRRMMFWGDIILHHPELIPELPRDVIALNWGYEASHPFAEETARFAAAGIPFYVCPGTSTWMTMIGKHDNAFANLRAAARAGRASGASGYLNTDWGDGGHPQPPAVSWLPVLAGAALSWCEATFHETLLVPVASRELFHDPTGRAAAAALALGLAHRKLKFTALNTTPLGAAIAAPAAGTFELFCRDGLKYYARIKPAALAAARAEIETQRRALAGARPRSAAGRLLVEELDLAARMALGSCDLMRWQQRDAAGNRAAARRAAVRLLRDLAALDADYTRLWPRRNRATPRHSSAFLQWRRQELRQWLAASRV